jgi:hypothetical protein
VFLGVEIDSVMGELRLPLKKLQEFRLLVNEIMPLRRISLRRLQALAGKLNWASSVVRGGRTYLRRILDLMRPLKHAKHKLLITTDMREDLRWWQSFLLVFNGKRAILVDRPEVSIMVDASEKAGGLIYGNDWRFVNWKSDLPSVSTAHINVKETAAILLAARQWGRNWSGARVVVFTDNTTAMYAVNKGSSKSKEIMVLLRELFWLSCIFDFKLHCVHVPGVDNDIADCVSRLFENGRLYQMEAIFGYRTPLFYVLWPLAFLLHMSFAAFLSLIPQILRWMRSGRV